MREAIFEAKDKMVSGIIRKSITEHILRNGAFLVSQISEDTGYSVTTVAKYVQEMTAEGMIYEMDKVSLHPKGRKSVKYGMSPDSCYFLGVDPRPYELHIGLIDLVGNTVDTLTDDTFALENTYDSYEVLCSSIDNYISSLEPETAKKIKAMNINLPGRVNGLKGSSASFFVFEGDDSGSLVDMLTERFGMPVYIENDTKAMTYAELVHTIRDPHANLCYVNFSWGLGIGIVIDGKLFRGKDGYSGEFGHIHRYDNNILCHCGKKGCMETEISGKAIARKLKERIMAGETSILSRRVKSGENITTMDIISAIEKEDALCIELTSTAGTELGHQLAGVINLLNPDMIVIGGNFASVESCYFLQYINLAIRQYSLKLISKDLPVVSSSLGAEAGVLGACLIARSRYFNVGSAAE